MTWQSRPSGRPKGLGHRTDAEDARLQDAQWCQQVHEAALSASAMPASKAVLHYSYAVGALVVRVGAGCLDGAASAPLSLQTARQDGRVLKTLGHRQQELWLFGIKRKKEKD